MNPGMSRLLTCTKIQQGQVLSLDLRRGGLEPTQLFCSDPLKGYNNTFPLITKSITPK